MADSDAIISIQSVTKSFGGLVTAVDEVSLDIREGDFFALLGPSGCGKTTLLRMLAGFETPTEGAIRIAGQDMVGVPPNRRPVNMVFQSYAVFPHMTVADNVAYGLRVTGTPGGEIQGRVEEALELVKLGGYGPRKPDQLSGGQRQRVALARALVKQPKVLLLDEPLSALDAKLREAMQLELVRLQNAVGITFVIVTHDQHEALSMANRIAVMEAGKVRQVAPPAELYEFPTSRFVADFIGKTNILDARVEGRDGGKLLVRIEGVGQLALASDGPAAEATEATEGGKVGVVVRPEKVRLLRQPPGEGMIGLHGEVSEVAYYGDTSFVYVRDDSGRIISANLRNEARSTTPRIVAGEKLWCAWSPEDSLVLSS